MKLAKTADGHWIEARETAPAEAFCPYCGGRTVLRRRRQMGREGTTFFWRHRDNHNLRCPGRARPVR